MVEIEHVRVVEVRVVEIEHLRVVENHSEVHSVYS